MNSALKSLLLFVLLAAPGFAAATDFADTKKKAEAGNPMAQWLLGFIYSHGNGVPKDSAEAAKWFRKAADQGFARAQLNLGWFYTNGEGVPKDSAEAVKWFRLAAEQGDADAQGSLGMMYYIGTGVPIDFVQAHVWFNIAAANGNEAAKPGLESVQNEMTSEQKAEAMKLARDLFAKLPKG